MSYDMIDRFLRNNLGDDDYAEYSAALDSLCAPQRTEAEGEDTRKTWVGLTDEEVWESDGYKVAITDQETRWLYRFAREIETKLKEKNT